MAFAEESYVDADLYDVESIDKPRFLSTERQRELFGVGVDDMGERVGLSSFGTKKRRRRKDELDEESHRMMGEANMAAQENNYQRAVELCLEIFRKHPHVASPVILLSNIHQRLGQPEKAFDYFWFAAEISHSKVKLTK